MTPYWPSPLGATRRRLAPRRPATDFRPAAEFSLEHAISRQHFPKPDPGIHWVAETELPFPQDFDLGNDQSATDVG